MILLSWLDIPVGLQTQSSRQDGAGADGSFKDFLRQQGLSESVVKVFVESVAAALELKDDGKFLKVCLANSLNNSQFKLGMGFWVLVDTSNPVGDTVARHSFALLMVVARKWLKDSAGWSRGAARSNFRVITYRVLIRSCAVHGGTYMLDQQVANIREIDGSEHPVRIELSEGEVLAAQKAILNMDYTVANDSETDT